MLFPRLKLLAQLLIGLVALGITLFGMLFVTIGSTLGRLVLTDPNPDAPHKVWMQLAIYAPFGERSRPDPAPVTPGLPPNTQLLSGYTAASSTTEEPKYCTTFVPVDCCDDQTTSQPCPPLSPPDLHVIDRE